MAYRSTYDPEREADLRKQSARGRSIARRGRDIKEFRKSLPPFPNPEFGRYKQKEYTYSPNWRDVDSEQLRKKEPGSDAKEGWLGQLFSGLRRDAKQQGSDLTGAARKSGLVRDITTMGGDLSSMVGLGSLLPMFGNMVKSQERARENEEILGGAYTTDVREEMMSPSDREYYEKYKRMAAVENNDERKQFYLDQADTALRNANITNRVNYALDDLGFDTSAVAGRTPFGEDQPVVDYGTLSGRLQSGLEETKSGKAFLKEHALPKSGDTPEITRAIENFYGGQSRLALDEELNTRIPPESVFGAELPIVPRIKPERSIAEAYGVELPSYSDVPVSILEDIDEDARLMEILDDIESRSRLEEDLLGRGAGLETPRSRQWPNTLPPGFVPPRDVQHPDFYDFLGQTYGPAGMDAYWDREEEEEIKGLWGPRYYPKLSPAGQ